MIRCLRAYVFYVCMPSACPPGFAASRARDVEHGTLQWYVQHPVSVCCEASAVGPLVYHTLCFAYDQRVSVRKPSCS